MLAALFFFCIGGVCLAQVQLQEEQASWLDASLQTDNVWKRAVVHVHPHRRRRDSEDGSYKNITIEVGQQKWSLELELEPPDFHLNTITLRDGDLSTDIPVTGPESCHWKGFVNGGGQARVSSCLDAGEFVGAFKTAEQLWLLRPARDSHSSRRRKRSHTEHEVASWDMISNYTSQADVARVPITELEAAARLAAQDAATRESQRAARETEDDYYPYYPSWFEQNGYYYDIDATTEKLLDRQSRTLDSKKKWVEMGVFTDESMYKVMAKKYPNETLAKLKDYATTMIAMMDLLYGDKSLSVDIGFRLVHMEVMKKSPTALDSNSGKAKAYLSSFCEYAGDQNANAGLWDHALLLTGLDLHESGLKSTAGLAWQGTMCYRYYSCSIAEGYSFGSAYIITHEIGHSLGMEHDGMGVSEVCDKDKYIMSPTTGAGKVTWSNCSGKNLQDFIEYGTSELRSKKYQNDMLSRPVCLTELVAKGKVSDTKRKLPGEEKDAYFQCGMGLGKTFKPYFQRNKAPFNNICWMLYCGNGTHAISTHPALEGTKCDKNKYCRSGQCIKR